jgi:hypothetical protein
MVERRIVSPLGEWLQTEWRPSADDPLAGAVELVWHFDGALTRPRERVFPDGSLQIVVQLDELRRPAGGDAPFPALCVSGMQTGPLVLEAPVGLRTRVLGVRLRPAAAYAVLGLPLRPVVGTSVALSDAIGDAADELGERCAGARSARGAVAAAAAWTRMRLLSGTAFDDDVAALADAIGAARGAPAIGELPKRLVARFHDQLGLAPKRYARLVRFRHALELLERGDRTTEIAVAAGYYDQPHLNADFREHAGISPRAFLRAMHFPGSTGTAEDDAGRPTALFFQDAWRDGALR